MAKQHHPDYPRIAPKTDQHGKVRWRMMDGDRKYLPGEPHSREFDHAYQALIEGRDPAAGPALPTAEVIQFTGVQHRTLDAAWAMLRKKREYNWHTLGFTSQRIYSRVIERFLDMPVSGASKARYGGGLLADLERRHVKLILEAFAAGAPDEDDPANREGRETLHMERTALLCLRKLIKVGFEEEWIKTDPTYGMAKNPETDGHETWMQEHLDLYETRWARGTPQRIAYALALWLGNRVSDVARLRWDHLVTENVMHEGKLRLVPGFRFKQFKGRGKKKKGVVFLPMTPMLENELAGLRREGPVLESGIKGRAYTDKRLSEMVSEWARQAGLPAGYTCHGLRKALGVKLAHADASTRGIMAMLGHSNPAMVEVYTREVEVVRMAMNSTDKLVAFEVAKGWKPEPKIRVVK